MGPKKDAKKGAPKSEGEAPVLYDIDDPINTETWNCAVIMAVEKTYSDGYILKEFSKESLKGRRQEVFALDFDTVIMDVLDYFASGEIPYKYAFLMNFSSIFEEAVTYVTEKAEIPVILLVKVVKAFLFYLRDENLKLIKSLEATVVDPIKAMAERSNYTSKSTETKKGEGTKKGESKVKKGESRVKVKPPSVTKEDTLLLKRQEKIKFDQRIDDTPRNSPFKLYVLLTGFYKPDFPLELIKVGVPLHSLICVNSAFVGVQDSVVSFSRFQKQTSEDKYSKITNFWKVFLKILWDPNFTYYFRNTVFQVYIPGKFLCDKKKFREVIYAEISYLLYDISDLDRQWKNYLKHLNLRNVDLKYVIPFEIPVEEIDALPCDCISVPVMLQYVMDAICRDEEAEVQSSEPSEEGEISSLHSAKIGLCGLTKSISKELEERGEYHLLQVCLKTKELDVKYELCDRTADAESTVEVKDGDVTCSFKFKEFGENLKEALLTSDGVFGSYWKKYPKHLDKIYDLDHCIQSLLLTKVMCLYQNKGDVDNKGNSNNNSSDTESSMSEFTDLRSSNSEDTSRNFTKTRFTITEGTRSIVRSKPFNEKSISRDYFCPKEFQVVSLEKLEAHSAPHFRVTPAIQVQHLYQSEVFLCDTLKNPLENIKKFLDNKLFSNTSGFDFLELLNKPKLLEKGNKHWDAYNCIDHSYSFLNDSIYFVLHNRKDALNTHHETFNVGLKSAVGLRDFYDYVMEEESDWLRNQEELRQISVFLSNTIIRSDSFRYANDYEFWLVDSIKYQSMDESEMDTKNKFFNEIRTEPSMQEEVNKVKIMNLRQKVTEDEFEGYNISEMAVQFSGLKTTYYTKNCYVTVQLIERLYGEQELGVHVTAVSSTLHLYSYVCPEPHFLNPFTFHVTYKNGIIIAFGRRFLEVIEEVEEYVEKHTSGTTIKGKKTSEVSEQAIIKQVPKTLKDKEYLYDMVASLPNGLLIRTVRKIVEPCYIKQHYITKSEETDRMESSRLFLPNGNVVKMMTNGTVEILKIDTSIVTVDLSDLIEDEETKTVNLEKFKIVSGEGFEKVYEQGSPISINRIQIFQNTDLETHKVYYRRRDGTNYMQKDGSLCVQFNDGTRMSTTLLEDISTSEQNSSNSDESSLYLGMTPENDFDDSFVFVNFEVTIEHPDYATVIYNSLTQKWKILLPYDSTITIEPNGCYNVDIDKQTKLTVQDDVIVMESFSPEQKPLNIFTADISVVDKSLVDTYCQMKDITGKTFTLESDSNYSIDMPSEEDIQTEKVESCDEVQNENSNNSESVSDSLDSYFPIQIKGNKLTQENKYFVVKRDLQGMEIMHEDDVTRELSDVREGSLIYTLNIPETEYRCFVLITPQPKKILKKWEVGSILPDPTYKANPKPKTISSTYGVPPSWMHPFPKKRKKFQVPFPLTCRAFLETRKTDLSPQVGKIDNLFYEFDEITNPNLIPPNETNEFLTKLSNDDQDILKKMYILSISSFINEKKNQKSINSEKLKHYLEISKYYVELREYHKHCIRYNEVPDYFHHPAGMSWLILNDLLLNMPYPYTHKEPEPEVPEEEVVVLDERPPSIKTRTSEFSYKEIEYDLSISAGQSFSDLSFRSELSAQTAPPILRTDGVTRCKVMGKYHPFSSPVIKLQGEVQSMESIKEPDLVCRFQEKDIEKLEMKNYGKRKSLGVSLEDLMNLGLV